MRRKLPAIASHDARAVRVAWWGSFLATIALIALLGMAKSAQALSIDSSGGSPTLVLPVDDEFGDEAEASEEEEFEDEECEAGEEECEDETGAEAPSECLLSSAQATIFASPNRDQIRLLVRYTTFSPTLVAVDYGLHGAKGSLYLGSDKKRFSRAGSVHLTKNLSDPQMAKVVAAKGFTVRLRAAAAPHYCQALFERQLDVRRATPSGLTWQQSE